jgi:hypothetical protein
MLRLNLDKREGSWVDLGHGVRLFVEPLSTAIMLAARSDPSVIAAAGPEANIEEAADPAHDEGVAVVVAKAVARRVVKDWEGVGDEAGEPVKPTPEGIDALMDIWPMFEAFQVKVVAGAMLVDAEKNG